MLSRCYNPKNARYKSYGGRGITVCDEWQGVDGFLNFYHWAISNGFKEGLSIDRINNDGNYEPSNCRWATYKQQANNTSRNVKIKYKGITHTIAEWADIYELPASVLNGRLRKGWDIEKALTRRINPKKSGGSPLLSWRIYKLCKERNIAPVDVEKRIGSNPPLLRWDACTPKDDAIRKVADYFGITYEQLMKDVIFKNH